MAVLKGGSVIYGGGVDIINTVHIPQSAADDVPLPAQADEQTAERDLESENEQRSRLLDERERRIDAANEELARLKEQYIEQGKQVILEAKRRAEGIIQSAQESAVQITADAQNRHDDVLLKARAEGFELGKKDGTDACLAAGRDILDEAKEFAQRINAEKDALFKEYEKEIFDTIMEIAKKVTLDSLSSKDSQAVRRLIKKAAKDFRNSERIKITLNKNGANEELAGDYEYLKELCGGIANVEVELLPDAEEGTVIVDNGSEITDAGIQTQLRMIKELGSGKFRSEAKSAKTINNDEN